MLKYKQLRWSNCFSYGEDNKVDLDSVPITQIIGKNGHGKSSIALILEEVLYNKNSKGIKKGSILNRYAKKKEYVISLDFEKDNAQYTINVRRGSTQTVELIKDGVDISSHTATNTFKDIEKLVGYDHKTFCQIVYQSSTQSLEFLTATDTQRKKFLIDLLNLGRYTAALDVVKEESSKVGKELAAATATITQAKNWLAKFEREDLTVEPLVDEPDHSMEIAGKQQRIAELDQLVKNIVVENNRRTQNNQYKKQLDQIVLKPAPTEQISDQQVESLRTRIADCAAAVKQDQATLAKLARVKDTCPTCGSKLSTGSNHEHVQQEIQAAETNIASLKKQLAELELEQQQVKKLQDSWREFKQQQETYEKYHSLYDSSVPSDLLEAKDLKLEIATLESEIVDLNKQVDQARRENSRRTAKNAKIQALLDQRNEIEQELVKHAAVQGKLETDMGSLTVLTKAFSTTGLVAYKIECLVKDLEEITNEYLAEMADGRFQISFQVNTSDKLNVVITDNGEDIEITALSSGERARVNIATLLAIRKLMQSLSNTRTNLLILDETVENLDAEGKEKLIEILVGEPDLNTFLISHGFSHPLLEKLNVTKKNNISRIEQ